MSKLIGFIIAVIVIIAILIFFGFLDLSPEGEAAIENTQQNVGEAIENTGEAIQGDGN
ncbi:hypothetical protein FIU97_15715 [Roseivivax sp. THAF40]|uniref:hypothetical protein n=1 Tax=unclassified Roseivivax TaxID=2639302 RepID=UPI0012A90F70|nr:MULTISPECIES: hypothetical protein [unclassified Roseivivax]QFS84201.1 hypothetical protein FIV09_15300 [Roseivivax sp. THAF197b]QFT48029.1 hypothetical protein FIU97_15715 [Roseivivax sp. THAF40]